MSVENEEGGSGSRAAAVLRLKQLNARLTTLQNLVQDYSQEMMPSWISLSTTSFCNLRCPHCQTHGTAEIHKQSNSEVWQKDLVARLAAETLPYAFEFNLGLNGEPLTTPYLRQRLREFRKYGAKFHLTTNGTLLSKKTIARVLPITSQLHISIDGATEVTCEAIRMDCNFRKLLHNIKVLTKAYELLPEKNSIDMALACTVMASNVREMPVMVRMAEFLNIPTVNFYNLVVFFSHVRGEDLGLYKPLYNAYRDRAQREADRRGIFVHMPDAFPGVNPDADLQISGPGLIATPPARDYYDRLPTFESLVDLEATDSEAEEVVVQILEERAHGGHAEEEGGVPEQSTAQLESSLKRMVARHESALDSEAEAEVPYCQDLFERTFVTPSGDVAPCCRPGRPVFGNVHTNSVREIYNGTAYNDFRTRFFSSKPPDVCNGCRYFVTRPKQQLLAQISSLGGLVE